MFKSTPWLPLFPLNAVLFPKGILPLKVFETRYIGMVRECARKNAPFGVVRLRSDRESGTAGEPDAVGCLAHVQEATMEDSGAMMLRAQGGERFRILQTRLMPDERLEAQVEMIAADPRADISPAHITCATALKAVIDDIHLKGQARQGNLFISPFAQPLQFDETAWVANRWCEILPIPLKARQKLLELEDAKSRLAIVHQYLQQHHIL